MAFVVWHQNTSKMRTGNDKYIRILARLHLRNTCAYMTFSSHFDKGVFLVLFCFVFFWCSDARTQTIAYFAWPFVFTSQFCMFGNLRCITWPIDTTVDEFDLFLFFYLLCTEITLPNCVQWNGLNSLHFFVVVAVSQFWILWKEKQSKFRVVFCVNVTVLHAIYVYFRINGTT